MSTLTVIEPTAYTTEQISLIKATVAKGATDSELELFLYRCKNMNLDPLKPGQIHFVKYGTGPGTIVIGIEGFRLRAGRTGKHAGTKRGVIRDEKGRCVGAWAEVYRSDWKEPAREEVSLSEYNKGKAGWATMPETMIKKCAEAAALRMAFPDELGGIYSQEEMDQAEEKRHAEEQIKRAETIHAAVVAPAPDDSEYVIPWGAKLAGKRLHEAAREDLIEAVTKSRQKEKTDGVPLDGKLLEFVQRAEAFLKS